MLQHFCFNEDYPGGKLVCTCSRGEDHLEELFDVPVSEENVDGVWVVYDYDSVAYPIKCFAEENYAYRWRETQEYGHVKFWPFGELWSEVFK